MIPVTDDHNQFWSYEDMLEREVPVRLWHPIKTKCFVS